MSENRRNAWGGLVQLRTEKKSIFSQFVNKIYTVISENIVNEFRYKFIGLNFTTQAMLVLTPLLILLAVLIILTHWHYYNSNLIDEYLGTYGNEIVIPTIEGQQNFNVELQNEVIMDIVNEKIKHLVFYKIMITELNYHSFLNQQTISQMIYYGGIYNKVSSALINGNLSINPQYNFTIDPLDIGRNMEYNLETIQDVYFKDLMKLFYLNTPLVIQNQNILTNELVQMFFIAYSDNNYTNSPQMYFQYPTGQTYNTNQPNKNFVRDDFILDPVPYFYNSNTPNWFGKKDLNFAWSPNSTSTIDMEYSKNYDQNLIKSEFVLPSIEFRLNVNGNKINFAIISKMSKSDFNNKSTYFSFLNLENELDKILTPQDEFIIGSYVVANPRAFPISTASIYDNYFSNSMLAKNPKSNYQGYNLDVLDLKLFNSLESFFDVSYNVMYDSSIFKLIYFYNSFLVKFLEIRNAHYSTQTTNTSISNVTSYLSRDESFVIGETSSIEYNDKILLKIGRNESSIVEEVCSQIDLLSFYFILEEFTTVECFTSNEISRYSILNETSYSGEYQDFGLEKVNCYCLIFYCLQLNNKTSTDNFSNLLKNYSETNNQLLNYAKEITLPSKCTVQLKGIGVKSNSISGVYAYDFKFIPATTKTSFDLTKSLLNIFVMENNKYSDVMYNLQNNLSKIIISIFTLYCLFSLVFFLFLIVHIYKTLGQLRTFIKENDNFSYFVDSKTLAATKAKNSIDIISSKRTNVFILRNEAERRSIKSITGLQKSKSLDDFKANTNSNYSTINYEMDLPSFNFEQERNPSKLETINEFNDVEDNSLSASSNNENEDEVSKIHNESRLHIENGVKSCSNMNIEEYKLNENLKVLNILKTMPHHAININTQEEVKKGENSISAFEINNSQESISSNCESKINVINIGANPHVEDSLFNLERLHSIPRDLKMVTKNIAPRRKSKKRSIINSFHFPRTTIFQDKRNLHVDQDDNEIKQIFDLIESNSDLFRIDFNYDINSMQNNSVLQKLKKINKKYEKMTDIFDSHMFEAEMDYQFSQELSKDVLHEVASTEVFNFQGLSFNFRFKYLENTKEDTTTIKKILHTNNLDSRRRSSFMSNIGNFMGRYKLVEKETSFDCYNDILEKNLTTENQGNDSDIVKIDNLKSLINLYLENIHLRWIECIYENKFEQLFES